MQTITKFALFSLLAIASTGCAAFQGATDAMGITSQQKREIAADDVLQDAKAEQAYFESILAFFEKERENVRDTAAAAPTFNVMTLKEELVAAEKRRPNYKGDISPERDAVDLYMNALERGLNQAEAGNATKRDITEVSEDILAVQDVVDAKVTATRNAQADYDEATGTKARQSARQNERQGQKKVENAAGAAASMVGSRLWN